MVTRVTREIVELRALRGPQDLMVPMVTQESMGRRVHGDPRAPQGAKVQKENLGSLEFRGPKVTLVGQGGMALMARTGRREREEKVEQRGAEGRRGRRGNKEIKGRVERMEKPDLRVSLGNWGRLDLREKRGTLEIKVGCYPL